MYEILHSVPVSHQVGAWGCFDEFNRIPIEVLSVVASQVKTILDAIVRYSVPSNRETRYAMLPAGTPNVKIADFDFFGDTIALVPTTGLFITMNPGYAGRTELPENLKALFRSCAMIRPDLKPISENMLMAEGFVKARPLAVKFVTLYELSSELLSKQAHYDWGLRAVKSVLRVAGMLKRADPQLEEDAILMRALRDFNKPKIPTNDSPIFLRLISDLFPSQNPTPKVSPSNTCIAHRAGRPRAVLLPQSTSLSMNGPAWLESWAQGSQRALSEPVPVLTWIFSRFRSHQGA
jgi:dynein heavy chain, axonemal